MSRSSLAPVSGCGGRDELLVDWRFRLSGSDAECTFTSRPNVLAASLRSESGFFFLRDKIRNSLQCAPQHVQYKVPLSLPHPNASPAQTHSNCNLASKGYYYLVTSRRASILIDLGPDDLQPCRCRGVPKVRKTCVFQEPSDEDPSCFATCFF